MFSKNNLSGCMEAFVMSLINNEVLNAVVSPGSRNFPIIKALVSKSNPVTIHSIVDERCAGFFAIGIFQATQTPAIVCCTSGTAALNYYPAIAEAYYSKIPLIILTADRPTESIDNWEGQSIRQTNLFEKHTCASFQLSINDNSEKDYYETASMAYDIAVRKRGPVHINLPFQEPFYKSESTEIPDFAQTKPKSSEEVNTSNLKDLISEISNAQRILWLNGATLDKQQIKYPDNLVVFSDVISGKNETIDFWENILINEQEVEPKYLPDLIITTGMYFVSKKLRLILRSVPNLKHFHLSDEEEIPTPFKTKPQIINQPIDVVLDILTQHYRYSEYKALWSKISQEYNHMFNQLAWNELNEFSAIKDTYERLVPNSTVHVSSSMPVRFLSYLKRRDDVMHYSNRGTSGIDGCTSTAVGYASATDKEVVLLSGDIAFLYDSNGLWNQNFPKNLKVIVFNNNGGGIFELIEGPSNHIDVLPFQTTNHEMNMKKIVEQFNLLYFFTDEKSGFKSTIKTFLESKGPGVLEIQTKREVNTAFYKKFKSIKY